MLQQKSCGSETMPSYASGPSSSVSLLSCSLLVPLSAQENATGETEYAAPPDAARCSGTLEAG